MAQIEENNKRNKILTVSVVSFLIIVFIVGFVYGLRSVLAMEGQYEPVILKSSTAPPPNSGTDADTYLKTLIKKAEKEMPKSSDSTKFNIDTDTIETNGSDELKSTLDYLSDSLENYMEDLFESEETEFFKPVNIRSLNVNSSDIVDFSCTYIYYQCPSCDEESDEPLDSCEKCGGTEPYQEKYRDEFDISITLNPDSDAVIKNNFTPRTQDEINAIIKDGLENVVDVSVFTVDYKELKVNYKADRVTQELSFVRFTKVMDISAILTFKGDYKALGSNTISFTASEETSYNLTWPSLELNKETMVIEPKNSDNLLATLTCDDPTAYEVKWISSNERIVSVDNEGYLKAGKEPGSAIITAEYKFGGNTYSDTCEVIVRVPVESMRLNKRNLKLGAGETYQLSATVSPKDATEKGAKWYSENDSIATVDENGLVTAVKSGTVIIYALSDDGYYKSSCEVNIR